MQVELEYRRLYGSQKRITTTDFQFAECLVLTENNVPDMGFHDSDAKTRLTGATEFKDFTALMNEWRDLEIAQVTADIMLFIINFSEFCLDSWFIVQV